jgi:futalosine hydrolase
VTSGLRVLVVTAVAAERDAVAAALPAGADTELVVTGAGPAAAAAGTSAALAASPAGDAPGVELVLCAGIGGGFGDLPAGGIAVASAIAFADLGAETATGFIPASELGFGTDRYPVPAKLAVELADRTGGRLGTVLTVATVTGTAESAAALIERYPDAVAEGMEGAGVAAAAAVHGVPVAELRAISNAVGPRDRDAWDVPRALDALGRAVASVFG